MIKFCHRAVSVGGIRGERKGVCRIRGKGGEGKEEGSSFHAISGYVQGYVFGKGIRERLKE